LLAARLRPKNNENFVLVWRRSRGLETDGMQEFAQIVSCALMWLETFAF